MSVDYINFGELSGLSQPPKAEEGGSCCGILELFRRIFSGLRDSLSSLCSSLKNRFFTQHPVEPAVLRTQAAARLILPAQILASSLDSYNTQIDENFRIHRITQAKYPKPPSDLQRQITMDLARGVEYYVDGKRYSTFEELRAAVEDDDVLANMHQGACAAALKPVLDLFIPREGSHRHLRAVGVLQDPEKQTVFCFNSKTRQLETLQSYCIRSLAREPHGAIDTTTTIDFASKEEEPVTIQIGPRGRFEPIERSDLGPGYHPSSAKSLEEYEESLSALFRHPDAVPPNSTYGQDSQITEHEIESVKKDLPRMPISVGDTRYFDYHKLASQVSPRVLRHMHQGVNSEACKALIYRFENQGLRMSIYSGSKCQDRKSHHLS